MKITIFTSTFNRVRGLLRLIESLEEQTYTNWEFIIVDDGSADNTEEKISDNISEKISYFNFIENKGHPEALFNIDICSKIDGDLVIFIGSDDFFYDKYSLQKVIDKVTSLGSDVWKIGFSWVHENALDEGDDHFSQLPNMVSFNNDEVVQDSYFQSDYLFVYRRKYWEAFSTYFISGDHFFSAFYDVALNNCYREIFFREVIVIAGWGEDNLTKGNNAEKYFNWSLLHQKYMLSKYNDRMGPNYLNYSYRSFLRSSMSHGVERSKSFKIANKAVVMSFKFFLTGLLGYVAAIWPFPRFVWHLKRILLKRQKKRG